MADEFPLQVGNRWGKRLVHWLYHSVRYFLNHWGYWAILAGLWEEDAGLPLPGETALMFTSFLANQDTSLHLYWIISAGTAAATMDDNIGFLGTPFWHHSDSVDQQGVSSR